MLIAREAVEFHFDPRNTLELLKLARGLCPILQKDNAGFDRKRFLRACCLESYTIAQLQREIKLLDAQL